MQLYSLERIQALAKQGKVLEQDSFGPKVVAQQDGTILKLFRRKRLISSALFMPYSRRFMKNSEVLTQLGIPTVKCHTLLNVVGTTLTGVIYTPLPGDTLTDLLRKGDLQAQVSMEQLAKFIQKLHQQGVYFRSLHLGNIVRTPEGALGLIDIADMQFKGRPLNASEVERNFAHFGGYLKRESSSFDMEQLHQLYSTL